MNPHRKTQEHGGEDVASLMQRALNMLRHDQPDEAIKMLEQVNVLDADFEPGYCYRILAHAQLGQHDEAEVMFYMARQVLDQCPRCYHHMAQSLAKRDQWDRALACWEQAAKLSLRLEDFGAAGAHGAKMHRCRGVAWCRTRCWKQAAMDYRAALHIEPHDVATIYNLALASMEQGRLIRAWIWLGRGLANKPDDLSLRDLRRRLRWLGAKHKVAAMIHQSLGIFTPF